MSSDPRNAIGRRGEDYAAAHLERRGFRIVERNYRTRVGELDLVAFNGLTMAFCEVKTRRLGRGDLHPFASLGPRKQAQVRAMSVQWLAERPGRPYAAELRFDAIGVWIDEAGRLARLEHLEGAF